MKKQIPVQITYHQNAVSSGMQVLFIKSKLSVILFSRNTQAWARRWAFNTRLVYKTIYIETIRRACCHSAAYCVGILELTKWQRTFPELQMTSSPSSILNKEQALLMLIYRPSKLAHYPTFKVLVSSLLCKSSLCGHVTSRNMTVNVNAFYIYQNS